MKTFQSKDTDEKALEDIEVDKINSKSITHVVSNVALPQAKTPQSNDQE